MNARQRSRMCTDKVRYATARDAARAIEQHRKRFKVAMRSYPCPFCHGHHLSRKER